MNKLINILFFIFFMLFISCSDTSNPVNSDEKFNLNPNENSSEQRTLSKISGYYNPDDEVLCAEFFSDVAMNGIVINALEPTVDWLKNNPGSHDSGWMGSPYTPCKSTEWVLSDPIFVDYGNGNIYQIIVTCTHYKFKYGYTVETVNSDHMMWRSDGDIWSTYWYDSWPESYRMVYNVDVINPPPPLSVDISGPTHLDPDEYGTFTANPSGGYTPYTNYQWWYRNDEGTIPPKSIKGGIVPMLPPAGYWIDLYYYNGEQTITFGPVFNFSLKCKVTDSEGNTAIDIHSVMVY